VNEICAICGETRILASRLKPYKSFPMQFSNNENQQMIAEMIRKFGEEHIRPKMMVWDESQEFPVA